MRKWHWLDPSNSAPENIFEAFNLPLRKVLLRTKHFFYFYQFSDDSYDEERLMITMAEKYEHKVWGCRKCCHHHCHYDQNDHHCDPPDEKGKWCWGAEQWQFAGCYLTPATLPGPPATTIVTIIIVIINSPIHHFISNVQSNSCRQPHYPVQKLLCVHHHLSAHRNH